MRPSHRSRGFTIIELAIILLSLFLLVFILIPRAARARRSRCENNLLQIGLSFRTWALDSSDAFATTYPVRSGGAKERVQNGDVAFVFLVMSNELSEPKILHCPRDRARRGPTKFDSGLSNTNLSYFVSLDAQDIWPQVILSGDRHLALNGRPLGTGLFQILTNSPLTWTKAIHRNCGNLLLSDGSVQTTTQRQLTNALANQGIATNHLAP